MSRILPRSMMGQMLLAVAVALLLVQGIGAALVFRAQSERLHAAMLHGAAFQLIAETISPEISRKIREQGRLIDRRGSRFRGRPHGFRLEQASAPPMREGEVRDGPAEAELRRILTNQGLDPVEVVVTERAIGDDFFVSAVLDRRAALFGADDPRFDRSGHIMVAGVRMSDEGDWLVARVRGPRGEWDLVVPLLLQTLIIYVVLVGAVALIMRRITQPLAALTRRVERFGETRDAEGQLAPQGPNDIRRLIKAHNAMEARIAALLDEKDVMLGAIGHDLKTPLAALRVRIESVEDEVERQRMAETIEDIVRTLDDILSLARVGRPSDPEERTELSALVASVVEEYEDMGDPVELGATERVALQLRPTWLRRALRNLIGNALRYGRSAAVSVSRQDGRAIIRIDDYGPGIPEAAIANMMEPFTRGEPSRNTETGGAGLGLALARAVAEQHGGTLRLANRRDARGVVSGLTATLGLPLI